ncbi:hypothetical protein [Stappia sp.]|uniref:hypothetical protein n=1 Tax=Stappia sp. TaxID=1870903 RepID=UPI003A9902A9
MGKLKAISAIASLLLAVPVAADETLAIAATGQTWLLYDTAVAQVLGDTLEGANITVLETGGYAGQG